MASPVSKEHVVRLISYSLVFAAGLAAGWLANDNFGDLSGKENKSKVVALGHQRLLNPLLDCEVAETRLRTRQLKPFKSKIQKIITDSINKGMASQISVYFRDLDDGKVFEINADRGYSPASLGKVPIMMAYLKRAESDPGLLKKRILYDGKQDLAKRQNFKPRETLVAGKSYTVDELIYRMIAYSDNNAWKLLINGIDEQYLNTLVAELGADFAYDDSGKVVVTVKSYSIFLRVLYNASYLNKEMSEKALEYLSVEEFPFGISSSIPAGVTIASKFGEKESGKNLQVKSLHNYGIVYHAKQPYLICIMTEGDNFYNLAPIIHEISSAVYAEVDSQTRGQ
jgi:beta-lactamase class A